MLLLYDTINYGLSIAAFHNCRQNRLDGFRNEPQGGTRITVCRKLDEQQYTWADETSRWKVQPHTANILRS